MLKPSQPLQTTQPDLSLATPQTGVPLVPILSTDKWNKDSKVILD